MKKIFLNRVILTVLCFAIGVVFFASCEKEDSVSVVVVELQAFGPSPVLRGNDITFIGENLDKVTAVVIPGCPAITDITVVSPSIIQVKVPQEATEGAITLQYPGGEIVTKATLSFTEPYSIESIAPLELIREGEEVTIKGDYLWNITGVAFSGN
ncbi:hypothetical protein EZS27_013390, partial [termite gut metagenome]